MPMTAVICANLESSDSPGTGRAQLYFAGQSVLEYQARQAAAAGADHVIALVDAVNPALSRTVDRMMGEGVRVQLIRDMPTLMREIPRDRDVLLFVDGAIAPQDQIDSMTAIAGAALLVVEDGGMTPHLERIDGMHRWCGIAKLTPDVMSGTLDLIGDWDLCSTLMRAAVQAGAKRVAVPQNDVLEGRVAIIDRQATADLVAQAILAADHDERAREPGLEHYIFAPLARVLSSRFVRMQVPGPRLRQAAVALVLLGFLALMPGWPFLTLLALMAARVADLAADQIDELARRSAGDGWFGKVPLVALLAGLVALGWAYGAWESALYLAVLVATLHFAARRHGTFLAEPWMYLTPGTALICMGAGMLVGRPWAILLLANLLAIGSIANLLLRQPTRIG